MAGFAWCTKSTQRVAALPEEPTDDEIRKYRDETYVSEKRYASLSWPGAAMLVMPISPTAASGPLGVLIVERRESGSEVPMKRELYDDAALCGYVLGEEL